MSVASLLEEVQFGLIAQGDFVRTIQHPDSRCEHLVGIAQTNAVELATEEESSGDVGTVAHSSIETPFLKFIAHLQLYVLSPVLHVGHHHERRVQRE